MRVDSHTQDWQAMRVLIHTHISCRLLVEGNAPKPLLNTEFHSVAARSPNAFLSVSSAPLRSIGVRESLTPFANMARPKIELPLKAGVAKYHTSFFVPRRLRASRFTRLLQTRMFPPPCRSAGYAVRRVWFCSRTLPDVLPAGGWHSHSNAW